MTVKNLIEQLQELDEEATVTINILSIDNDIIAEVEEVFESTSDEVILQGYI